MYRIKAKCQKEDRRVKYPKEFPSRKAVKAIYFANWDSACKFCVTAGLRLKQISVM